MAKYTRDQLKTELFAGVEKPDEQLQHTLDLFGIQSTRSFSQEHYDTIAWSRDWIADQISQGLTPEFGEQMLQARQDFLSTDDPLSPRDQLPNELQLIDNVAGGSAVDTLQVLADQGITNVEQARKAFNILYTQKLRELVNSGELERMVVEAKATRGPTVGKSFDLLEQAQQLVASRNSSAALPEGSSD
jgi:hypothetical protein